MKRLLQSNIIATGLAMFSMFFGSGNLIFPLVIGKLAGDKNIFAIAGLLISAVGIPFLGLAAIILFNGNYKAFFFRIGKVPGFILMVSILGLLGPLGIIPRCIVISYGALSVYCPNISLLIFSLLSAVIIFLCTIQENKIISLLGRILSPLLIMCLGIIIIKGLWGAPLAPARSLAELQLFWDGFIEGYKTFDLFAALFFSAAVLSMIKKTLRIQEIADYRTLSFTIFKSSIIGATLLALVYVGMSFIAAAYSEHISTVTDQQLFIVIARYILGNSAGLIVCLAVILACLTTAIALAAISAEFLEQEIFFKRLKYEWCLLITLFLSIPISILRFDGIMQILFPFLKVVYPAVIMLVILNIAYKLFDFKIVKIPFYITFFVSLYMTFGGALNNNLMSKVSFPQMLENIQKLPFGSIFSPHMFVMEWDKKKGWHNARIQLFQSMSFDPSTIFMHYGPAIFEGMKAFKTIDNKVALFRPRDHLMRMNRSAKTMCMPDIDVEFVLKKIKELITLDIGWVPAAKGTSLYIRPTMIATENTINLIPSNKFTFFIILSPVGAFYAEGFNPIKILVADKYTRTTLGGVGEAKTAGNYAAAMKAQLEAKEAGFAQVLWLDSQYRKNVEEVGSMNIFFVINNQLVTPELSGTILPGITRKSIIEISKRLGIDIVEKKISINEVIQSIENGTLTEAFGSGTAAVISPIKELGYKGKKFIINAGKTGSITKHLFEAITSVQYGLKADMHKWLECIE